MDVVLPDFIDNVHKTLSQSLKDEIKPGSKISIAASCFSNLCLSGTSERIKKH